MDTDEVVTRLDAIEETLRQILEMLGPVVAMSTGLGEAMEAFSAGGISAIMGGLRR